MCEYAGNTNAAKTARPLSAHYHNQTSVRIWSSGSLCEAAPKLGDFTSGVPLETARTMVLLPTLGAPTSTTEGVDSSMVGMRRRDFCTSPRAPSAAAFSCTERRRGKRYHCAILDTGKNHQQLDEKMGINPYCKIMHDVMVS